VTSPATTVFLEVFCFDGPATLPLIVHMFDHLSIGKKLISIMNSRNWVTKQLRVVLLLFVVVSIAAGGEARGGGKNDLLPKAKTVLLQKQEHHDNVTTLFLHHTPLLKNLVVRWMNETISPEEAKKALFDVVSSDDYIMHRPNRGIVFIKTHKTGSSTVTSVLHSLATSHHNVTIPVVKKIDWDLRQKSTQTLILHLATTIAGVKGAPYDIWCNHVFFDNTLLEKVVPSARNTMVSIVRDPATQMRSACNYFGCCPADEGDTSVWDNYALSPKGQKEFKSEKSKHECHIDRSSRLIVGNGIAPNKTFSENFDLVLDRIQSNELLALVMERMEESLLAFWHSYSLHPLDVSFISKKVRESLPDAKSDHTLKAEQAVREMSKFDLRLHKAANIALDVLMNDLFPGTGARTEAVAQLVALNDLVLKACTVVDEKHTPELNYWCKEKELDNTGWNEEHLKMLEDGRRSHHMENTQTVETATTVKRS
jgi:hypothetical protein